MDSHSQSSEFKYYIYYLHRQMEKDKIFQPKKLLLAYEEYEKRGFTIQSLIIDKYVVYDLIGIGSYGSVYSGMDDQSKKQVAVKVLDLRKMKAEKNQVVKKIKLRLAESEPRLMYECDSAYLLKCFDVYQNEDLKILIIEYCNGSTLQAEIDAKGRIPQTEAWMILKHIINGLMVLHSYNIVHRDLKAENIMSHNGTYKIIDFGFSKKLQISQYNAQIRNTSLGTITTMAPEVMGRKPYGLKADIWSLGIIFFQMIYGTYPYDSVTAAQMYREIQAKKLFNKEEPFNYNGYTPSKDAYNFLRFTIVVDTDGRPDWRGVSEYPNIKSAGHDDLSQRFLKQCSIQVKNNFDYRDNYDEGSPQYLAKKSQQNFEKQQETPKVKISEPEKIDTEEFIKNKKAEEEKKMKQERQLEERRKFQEEARRKEEEENKQKVRKKKEKEKDTKEVGVLSMNQAETKKKVQEINRQDEKEYIWTSEAHLECLKTQFVYREIIYPLQISGILDTDDRAAIEFYYLLSARCFNNMSPINDQLDQRTRTGQNKELIANLKTQVTRLYSQVQKKFVDFSEKLTKSESKVTSMMKDWFFKKISKGQFQLKDLYLTGIEKIQYTKDQQISFTYQFYQSKIKDVISKAKNMTSVLKRMINYKKIMLVKLDTLKAQGKNFQEFVQQTLIGHG